MSPAGNLHPLPHRASAGFTLIELLVVMTLIALLAVGATPILNRVVPGLEVKAAATDLGGTLRRARGVALRDNRETTVLIDLKKQRFTGADETAPVALPRGTAIELVTAKRETIDDTQGRIRFYPDGTSTGGQIVLARGAAKYAIEVDWFDGGVRLHETPAR